jgi:hypothetical protein
VTAGRLASPRLRRWLRPIGLAALGLVFSFANLWPVLRAEWGSQDDHEIALYLGPTQRMGLGGFLHFLAASEAGHPGGSTRYRPSYYFVRLTETLLWGAHPGLWYLARILMFATACAALLWVLRKYLSVVENAALVVYLGTLAMWTDIWPRLGPAEAYACFGLALFVVGAQRIVELRDRPRSSGREFALAVALFGVGGAIAIGSKENFVVLALPALLVAWYARRPGRDRWALATALALTGWAAFIAIVAAISVKRHGHVYREDTSLPQRRVVLDRGIALLWHDYRLWLFAGAVLFAAGIAWLRWRRSDAELRRLARYGLVAALAVLALFADFLWQWVFYNGGLPAGVPRYDFPALLTLPLFAYCAALFLVRLATTVGVPRWLVFAARAAAVIYALSLVHQRGFPLPAAARRTAADTRGYTASFKRLGDECKKHPGWPIVIEAYDAYGEYEVIASTQRWLYLLGGAPKTYLKLHFRSSSYKDGSLERMLATTLESLSQKGAQGNDSFLLTRPWSEFSGAPCINVNFHGPPTVLCSDVEP